jgi:hypothetical protein
MSHVELLLVIKFAAYITLFGHCPARHRFTFSYFSLISSCYKNCIPGQGVTGSLLVGYQLCILLVTNRHTVLLDTDICF